MAAVPFPLVSGFHREEVGRSLVFHSLWKPQQDSVIQISHPRMIRRPGGNNPGKYVLKRCQHEKIPAKQNKKKNPKKHSSCTRLRLSLHGEGFAFDSSSPQRKESRAASKICSRSFQTAPKPDARSDACSEGPSANAAVAPSQARRQKTRARTQRWGGWWRGVTGDLLNVTPRLLMRRKGGKIKNNKGFTWKGSSLPLSTEGRTSAPSGCRTQPGCSTDQEPSLGGLRREEIKNRRRSLRTRAPSILFTRAAE